MGGAAADGAVLKVGRLFDDVSARLYAQQEIAGIGRRQRVDGRATLGIQRLHKGEGLRFENAARGSRSFMASSCRLLFRLLLGCLQVDWRDGAVLGFLARFLPAAHTVA